jgi:hypothetical protein
MFILLEAVSFEDVIIALTDWDVSVPVPVPLDGHLLAIFVLLL